jgi:hypothetical protein
VSCRCDHLVVAGAAIEGVLVTGGSQVVVASLTMSLVRAALQIILCGTVSQPLFARGRRHNASKLQLPKKP